MLILLLWLKKLRQILNQLNLKLMIKSGLLSTRHFRHWNWFITTRKYRNFSTNYFHRTIMGRWWCINAFITEKQEYAILYFPLVPLIIRNNINSRTSKIIEFIKWSNPFWIYDKKMEHYQRSIKHKLSCRKWNYL